jgi:hypothetical protein
MKYKKFNWSIQSKLTNQEIKQYLMESKSFGVGDLRFRWMPMSLVDFYGLKRINAKHGRGRHYRLKSKL